MSRCVLSGLVLLPAAAAAAERKTLSNMNVGSEYLFANPKLDAPKQFNTSYASQDVEYFEIYAGPIETRYGQVFWQGLPHVTLPEDIRTRFDGKTIAITGYEQDQVIRQDGKPDMPVPIYWAYNHHYVAHLLGKHSVMIDTSDGLGQGPGGHPLHEHSYAIDDPNPSSEIPTSQFFSEGNGGESRKSYHGYPPGMAQLLESPTTFTMSPMQIDTWNRNTSYGDPFVPGPHPANSAAPTSGPDAVYSGILECPCTDRTTKVSKPKFGTQTTGRCATGIQDNLTCFEAGTEITMANQPRHLFVEDPGASENITVSSQSLPPGCSITTELDGSSQVIFNTNADSTASCGAASGATHISGTATSLVTFSLVLDTTVPGGLATMTLSGPADVWFGVGLGAHVMYDEPNAVIILGNGTVFEQRLADQASGTSLLLSVNVISNSVTSGVRTVVMTRAFEGKTSGHYTFDPSQASLPFINAIGRSTNFTYHAKRDAAVMHLQAADAPTCICTTGLDEYIYTEESGRKPLNKQCDPFPYGDLQRQHNPTCTLAQYQGGLRCCANGNILLDKQQNPWQDNKLVYWMKWRFYFQDYKPAVYPALASHQNLVRFFRETEHHAGEYDIVKAMPGTRPEDTIYQITSHFQVKDGVSKCNARTSPHCAGPLKSGWTLVYASAHCHAPSCLKVELWNADTGALLCRQEPHFGSSPSATPEEPYDEVGYIAIPPCLFGRVEDGLYPEIFLSYDTNLTSIKWNNNTYAHYGEMAMWQMRGYNAWDPNASIGISLV